MSSHRAYSAAPPPSEASGVPRVTLHVHPHARIAWIILEGDIAAPASARGVLQQLRSGHRRFATGVDVVYVDVTGLREITIELAVLLGLERRLYDAMGVTLAAVLSQGVPSSPSAGAALESFPLVGRDHDRRTYFARVSADARAGVHGWQRVPIANTAGVRRLADAWGSKAGPPRGQM